MGREIRGLLNGGADYRAFELFSFGYPVLVFYPE